jgi:DNA polymerase III subunit delta'
VTALIGHSEQANAFTAAFTGGRPHHAWLLMGQQGLGKALFAREAATWLLAGAPAGDGFAVPGDCDAARLMAAGSHLDYRLIERTNAKTGKLRAEIVIGQIVRRPDSEGQPLREFLSGTPMLGPRRVVVIDAADDMNRNTANALLKSLEEPSDDTVFLLISHSPGRLLPTIRSRCRALRFSRLGDAEVRQILAGADLDGEDEALLIELAAGCPGRALSLAGAGITALNRELSALVAQPVDKANPAALALAKSVATKGREVRYSALLDRVPAMIAAQARELAGPAREKAIGEWEQASRLAREAMPLNLEPSQVAWRLAMHLASVPAT